MRAARLEAGLDRPHHRIVALAELVLQPVDVNLVDAGESPQRLVGAKLHPEQRMPRDRPPAVAVAVDREGRMPAEVLDAHEPHAVEAHHHAGAPGREHHVVVGQHPVEPVADVERDHHLAARLLRRLVHRLHHRLDPVGERRMRRIGHQLVVLHEVDSGERQRADEVGRLPRGEADARLDDRADDRPALHAGEPPRALDPELRTGELGGELRRQNHVEELEAGEQPEFEEIPRHHRRDRRQARRNVRHGERHPHAAAGMPAGRILGLRGAGERRRGDESEWLDRLHHGGVAGGEVGRLARHLRERAGGLLARDRGGGRLQRRRGLHEVVGDDPRGRHGVSFRVGHRAALVTTPCSPVPPAGPHPASLRAAARPRCAASAG